MKRNVLFGIAHSLNHNDTLFVRGLFEANGHFFYLKPQNFIACAEDKEELWFPEIGDLIAFDAFFFPDQELEGYLIYDEIPGVKQIEVHELIAVREKPSLVMPRNLLGEKHRSLDLIKAVKSQDAERVKALLDQGADANSQDENGTSALLHAVGPTGKGNPKIAESLILFGADPSMARENGVSAFTFAKDKGFSSFQKLFQKADLYLATLSWLKRLRSEPIEDEDFEEDEL